jgi:hypothetical protein
MGRDADEEGRRRISRVAFFNHLVDGEGTRGGGIEVREGIGEVVGSNGSTVNESSISDWGLGSSAVAQVCVAESTHGGSQGNINNVISGSSSIGITGIISSENTKVALVALRGWGDGGVQSDIFNIASIRGITELIESLNSSEENGLEILSWIIGWGQCGEFSLQDGVHRGKEEGADNGGERGEGNISVEETILSGLASVPFILVLESNEKFIDEGISHAGLLSVSNNGASGSPSSNDAISRSNDARGWDLNDVGNNVEPSDDIVGLLVGDASREA